MRDLLKREDICRNSLIQDSMSYDKGIQMIARKLSMGDRFPAEELRNEMHIVILSMVEGYEPRYYFRAAKNKAIDYLKSKSRNYSYANATRHISLEAMRDAGFQIDTEKKVYAPENYSSVDMRDSDDRG